MSKLFDWFCCCKCDDDIKTEENEQELQQMNSNAGPTEEKFSTIEQSPSIKQSNVEDDTNSEINNLSTVEEEEHINGSSAENRIKTTTEPINWTTRGKWIFFKINNDGFFLWYSTKIPQVSITSYSEENF